MLDYKKLDEVKNELSEMMVSEHFAIRYGLRNPRWGKGLGPNGVGDPDLIRWYLSALERLYREMSDPLWGRRPPRTDASGKTLVYVCDLDQVGMGVPFTAANKERVPFIVLSSRSNEPLNDGVMRRAAAEAIHEATHVFNAEKRPFHLSGFRWWAWLDEAMATYMESRVLPGNQDYFRFLSNWIDLPGVPLNDWRASYQGCLFLHYLAEKVGPGFPHRIWIDSHPNERPLQAIHRLVSEKGRGFATSDPCKEDLFAHGYAMDSYFLRDHTVSCFAPELCSRFGERAVVESFDLSTEPSARFQGSLPHLATHYFRFFVSRQIRRVHFVLRAAAEDGAIPHKSEVAVVQADLRRGQRQMLRQFQEGDGSGQVSQTTEIVGCDELDLDHLVLVVSNCAHENRDLPVDNPPPVGDPYELEIVAR
jgi:hypothetical protein